MKKLFLRWICAGKRRFSFFIVVAKNNSGLLGTVAVLVKDAWTRTKRKRCDGERFILSTIWWRRSLWAHIGIRWTREERSLQKSAATKMAQRFWLLTLYVKRGPMRLWMKCPRGNHQLCKLLIRWHQRVSQTLQASYCGMIKISYSNTVYKQPLLNIRLMDKLQTKPKRREWCGRARCTNT